MPFVAIDASQDGNLLARQTWQESAGAAVVRRTVLRRLAALPAAMALEAAQKERLVNLDDAAQPFGLAPARRAGDGASARR